MLNSERKQKKHRHLWLTRDDVTRGTTLFQSSYHSALFYVYSICYTNIQLSASARQMLFIGRLPYWNFQKVRVKCSQPVTLHLCFTTSSVLTYVHSPKSKILLHNFTTLSTVAFIHIRMLWFQFTHFSATLRSISLISLFYHIHTKRSTVHCFSDDWCNFQYFASIIKSGSALSEPFLRRVCTYRF